MADKVLCEKSDLVAVANAIRSKNGTTNTYKVNQLASAVENISSGTTLPTLSNPGNAADLRSGKQLIDQSGNKITGTLATVTQATPSITVNSAGLITASATQSAGYVASGTKSATKQLPTKSAATITPGTSNQTIAAGSYLTGTQTIKGDSNLVAGNIKSGVSIFGVSGSYVGSGGGSNNEAIITITSEDNYIVSVLYLDPSGKMQNYGLKKGINNIKIMKYSPLFITRTYVGLTQLNSLYLLASYIAMQIPSASSQTFFYDMYYTDANIASAYQAYGD